VPLLLCFGKSVIADFVEILNFLYQRSVFFLLKNTANNTNLATSKQVISIGLDGMIQCWNFIIYGKFEYFVEGVFFF